MTYGAVVLAGAYRCIVSVKHELFKTCDQSGFCKRNRALADRAATETTWQSPFLLMPETLKWERGQLSGLILKTIGENGETARLPIVISFLESGSARVTIDEEKRQKGEIELRHDRKIRKERYNEASQWAITGGLDLSTSAEEERGLNSSTVSYGADGKFQAVITFVPFAMDFQRDGVTEIKINDRGLMNLDHWRSKVDKPEKKEGEEETPEVEATADESTWWEETFSGNTDTKPRGPESVALDITFSGYEHVYGIPEHASSMSLKETRGGTGNYDNPYRLYNLDVFEYEVDTPMTLYGSIPFMTAQKKNSTVGVFWLNAAETWVDIIKQKQAHSAISLGIGAKIDTKTHWISESGLLDVFVFLGPTPKDVTKAYGELTGFTSLPPDFALGYHQCRWNYVTDDDVKDVDRRMDKFKIPYDVIWLDIEYAEGKKYFTWDPLTFGNPASMLEQLDESSRKLVAIIDPHIKAEGNYYVSEQLKSKDLAVHDKDGKIYQGWCWPGNSNWIDAFNPAAFKWWVNLFKYDSFKGTKPNVHIWNDMNEPSVFNGPETTMPKDNVHYGDWEHRDLHNIIGMTVHNATYQGLIERKKGESRRPFVLTRSFYAGSQRLSAMWTGDNQAKWSHLVVAFPMIMNNGIAGYPFVGADVGGFFGNPEPELFTRWYQAGVSYPFLRGHAHIDTRRREPYLLDEPYRSIVTKTLRLRYSLLPVWYTAFHQASVDGTPIIRPNFYVYPDDEAGFGLDDQGFIGGSGLLAKPVVTEGATTAEVYFPDEEVYYDYFDYTTYTGKGKKTISAPLEKSPLFMQGSHIIPRKDRPRRSSGLMKWDPYTLIVVLGNTGVAVGELYFDDGETFEYQSGAHIHRAFQFTNNVLISRDIGLKGKSTEKYVQSMKKVEVERIIVVGAPLEWRDKNQVKLAAGKLADLEYHEAKDGKAAWAVVRQPKLSIAADWKIDFS